MLDLGTRLKLIEKKCGQNEQTKKSYETKFGSKFRDESGIFLCLLYFWFGFCKTTNSFTNVPQGRKYLSDFNIKEEAGGVGKGIDKSFDVDVSDNTLEIHLYWAGKGTTAIPDRGVYGPLISAISVTPSKP